jgi:hemophore-related protein
MTKMLLTRLAVAIGGSAVGLAAAAGVASASPDLGPAVSTNCSYPQLVSALNAQDPQAGAAFEQSPQLKAGLQAFLASGPVQRQRMAQRIANAPQFAPYLGSVEQAFLTCTNF